MGLNTRFGELTVVHAGPQAWVESPMPGVRRKRLELSGPAEAGRVTSVVEYAPGSTFRLHPHPQGEEILVLEGTFEDEHAVYPEGTFALNPEGFSHAPFSKGGCLLLVKLRQSEGERPHVRTETARAGFSWRDVSATARGATLSDQRALGFPEVVALLDLEAGGEARLDALAPAEDATLGDPLADDEALVEVFVVDGACAVAGERLARHLWLRAPARLLREASLRSEGEGEVQGRAARVYVKLGHRMPDQKSLGEEAGSA